VNDIPSLESLLGKAQAGDVYALATLLGRLRSWLRSYAQRRLGTNRNPQVDASDVAQEVCLRVHRAFDRLVAGCTVPQLLGWARKILHNVVIDHHRRFRGREVAGEHLFAGLATGTTGPEERVLRTERSARLEEAIGRLPEEQRLAFQLRFRDGLTFAAVGRRLGVRLGYARVLFLRATERLRKELGEDSWGVPGIMRP
jgi:RNA polymerase sigma-70 factor (ECF subfamily)